MANAPKDKPIVNTLVVSTKANDTKASTPPTARDSLTDNLPLVMGRCAVRCTR